jgi:hypothetical protein
MPHTVWKGEGESKREAIAMKERGAAGVPSGNISGPSRKRSRRRYHRQI